MNEELREICAADQADRQGERLPADLMSRARVAELLAASALEDGDDYFHAALVFQHGGHLEDFWQAHTLAQRAAELGSKSPARWLAAAAYDRWLTIQGKPQKYGTQYHVRGGRYELMEVDPATTDEERAAWNVPPLAEALRRADDLTQRHPPQPIGRPEPMAALEVDGMRVEVLSNEPVEGRPFDSQPVERMAVPVPEGVPADLEIRTVPMGYAAFGTEGLVVGWMQGTGNELFVTSPEPGGPAPTLEPVEIGPGRRAIQVGRGTINEMIVWRDAEGIGFRMVYGPGGSELLLRVARGWEHGR